MSLDETSGAARPLADIVQEARRIIDRANETGAELRLAGGLAVRLHATAEPHPALAREFKDIDLVAARKQNRAIADLVTGLGYTSDHRFNTLHTSRGLFYDERNSRQVDVFFGAFRMCHEIPIAERLHVDSVTIPLAELLLTKLQIIELNEKDLRDILALLVDHDVEDHDEEAINGPFIASLLADDWGLWRTTKLNLDRVREGVSHFDLAADDREAVVRRVDVLWDLVERAPKSRRWRMRDRLGDRVRWYEEPEEVD